MTRALRRGCALVLVAIVLVAAPGSFVAAGAVDGVPEQAGESAVELRVVRHDLAFLPQVWVDLVIEGIAPVGPDDLLIEGLAPGTHVDLRPIDLESVGVVLVIDTSGSMRGEAIETVRSAAIELIDGFPPGARIAVVAGGAPAELVVALTDDRATVLDGIASLEAVGETALYDALAMGIDQLADVDGMDEGIVLAMSDGADTASEVELAALLEQVDESGTTIHSLAVATSETATDALTAVSDASTGGLAVAVDDRTLIGGGFARLGSAVTGRYELRFLIADDASQIAVSLKGRPESRTVLLDSVPRYFVPTDSEAGPSSAVVPGAPMAIERELAPAPAATMTTAPSGTLSRIPVAAGAALLAAGLTCLVLLMGSRTSSEPRLVAAGRTEDPLGRAVSARGLKGGLGELAGSLERLAARRGRSSRIDALLEQAGSSWRPGEFLVLCGAVGVISGMAGIVIFGVGGVTMVVAGPVLGWLQMQRKAARRQARFAEQLGPALQLFAGNLRVGQGLLAALDGVSRESESPSLEEYQRVVAEVRLGRPLGESLLAMSDRLDNEDLQWVAEAVDIQREVGGDLAEVLDNVAITLSERARVAGQVEALAADGKLSSIVMMVLPFVVGGLISLSQPDYLAVFVTRSAGRVLLAIALALMIAGGVWLKKLITLVY